MPISKDYMVPILYHFYCMKHMLGPDTDNSIEVDHIIPQSLFNASATIPKKETIQHNVLNLGLLPKGENISKSDKKLIVIDDTWLVDQIERYEFIKKEDFAKYSNVNNYQSLFDYRKPIFYEAYDTDRDKLLNN